MKDEERIFEKVISNCKDCEHCDVQTFTTPDEKIEENPYKQPYDYYQTYFYAYCRRECKFIIPITTYISWLVSDPIKFPDFCPLAKTKEERELKEICEWFVETYPEEDDSVGGTLSDIIEIRNKMIDVLEYLERG